MRPLLMPLALIALAGISPASLAQADEPTAQRIDPVGQRVDYAVGDETFSGYYAPAARQASADDQGAAADAPRGSVLIIHDWDGLTDYERRRADMLAALGFDAFALDLYGKDNRPATVDARRAATTRLYADRERMRRLTLAGLEAARAEGAAEAAVVLGYCFGGAVALELARSSAAEDVAGYAIFHGGLATPEGQGYDPDTPPLLIAHGGADAAVPLVDVVELAEELEAAGVTYQVEIYSGAPHAFTEFGTERYRPRADERSWAALQTLLDEVL